jgi:hypothetical protein
MTELKDVVGAVLRDVALSRVISDQFSAEVSAEYEKDPTLGVFPTPRVEIKEASFSLRFAVDTVEKRSVDLTRPARLLAARSGAEVASEIFREVIEKHPNAAELVQVIESKGLDLRQRIEAVAGSAIAGDEKALEAARLGQTEAMVKRLKGEISAVLMEDAEIKKLLLTRGVRVGAINELVATTVNEAAGHFGEAYAAAAAAAERQSVAIHVGVTRKELDGVPDSLLSQINIVAHIRNYEWVETGEENGKPVKRLRPE